MSALVPDADACSNRTVSEQRRSGTPSNDLLVFVHQQQKAKVFSKNLGERWTG